IESISIRDQRPQLFRRRLQVEFPAIMEFLGHKTPQVLRQERNVYSTEYSPINKAARSDIATSRRAEINLRELLSKSISLLRSENSNTCSLCDRLLQMTLYSESTSSSENATR